MRLPLAAQSDRSCTGASLPLVHSCASLEASLASADGAQMALVAETVELRHTAATLQCELDEALARLEHTRDELEASRGERQDAESRYDSARVATEAAEAALAAEMGLRSSAQRLLEQEQASRRRDSEALEAALEAKRAMAAQLHEAHAGLRQHEQGRVVEAEKMAQTTAQLEAQLEREQQAKAELLRYVEKAQSLSEAFERTEVSCRPRPARANHHELTCWQPWRNHHGWLLDGLWMGS